MYVTEHDDEADAEAAHSGERNLLTSEKRAYDHPSPVNDTE